MPTSVSDAVLRRLHALSTAYAVMMRMGNMQKVMMASHISTTLGVITRSTKINQIYANIANNVVVTYTGIFAIFLVCPFGIATTQMPVITRRLNAADPTIVPGPKSLDLNLFPAIFNYGEKNFRCTSTESHKT